MKSIEEGVRDGQVQMKVCAPFGRIIPNQLNPQNQFDYFYDSKGKICYLVAGYEDNSFRIISGKETFKITFHKVQHSSKRIVMIESIALGE